MGLYDLYSGYIDPNQQKLALAQALFAAAAGMSGPQARGQSTIGNISQGIAQGTGMYQQAMNSALQQGFMMNKLKEMKEEEAFQQRLKTSLQAPIEEQKTVTEPKAPEDMPGYDPGTLTPDMYQQSVTKNISRMPGPDDYMDIYSKAAMESGRPSHIERAMQMQMTSDDKALQRQLLRETALARIVEQARQADYTNTLRAQGLQQSAQRAEEAAEARKQAATDRQASNLATVQKNFDTNVRELQRQEAQIWKDEQTLIGKQGISATQAREISNAKVRALKDKYSKIFDAYRQYGLWNGWDGGEGGNTQQGEPKPASKGKSQGPFKSKSGKDYWIWSDGTPHYSPEN